MAQRKHPLRIHRRIVGVGGPSGYGNGVAITADLTFAETALRLGAAAAIGLAAGLGFWPAAVVGTIIALVALLADAPVARLAARLARHRGDRGPTQ